MPEFSDTITLGSLVLGLIIAVATVSSILGGGRRWKTNYEAEHVERERLLALAEERNRSLLHCQGQILTLTSAIETVGGAKVYDTLQQIHSENTQRFDLGMKSLGDLFEGHERRAEERHEKLLGLFETVGHSLAELANEHHSR